jgi:hypothetical protein
LETSPAPQKMPQLCDLSGSADYQGGWRRQPNGQQLSKQRIRTGTLRNASAVRFIGWRGLPRRRERSEAGVVESPENRADEVLRNVPHGSKFLVAVLSQLFDRMFFKDRQIF